MKLSVIPFIVATLSVPSFAQLTDAPPVDMKQLLQGLRQFKEQNDTGIKTRRTTAYQQVTAAASSLDKASAFWTDAVLAVQFAGVDHQTTAVRDWKQGEGEGLKTKEGANAARLHLIWLGLTIQHCAGAETKQLLPNITDYMKQLEADDTAIDRVSDQIDKAKAAKRPGTPNKALTEDTHAKKIHDSILRTSVTTSPVAKRLQIADLLGEEGKRTRKGDGGEGASWEMIPGNQGGIYNAIILPEYRASKDPRLLDYWDMKIRKEQEGIYAGMPDFQERQWSQVKRPSLLWSRAQDQLLIGQRNRAITEMYNLIKAFPQHPDSAAWISQLEAILVPQAPATIDTTGSVAPPATIPAATAPGATPTAVLVPAGPTGVR
jgi:hypothetical protein